MIKSQPESADNNKIGKDRHEKMENLIYDQSNSHRDRHLCAVSIAGTDDRQGDVPGGEQLQRN